MLNDYETLIKKIDTFLDNLKKRYPNSIECKPKCTDCCVSGITVWNVEYDRIQEFVREQNKDEESAVTGERKDRCAFLDQNGLCSIYPVRPLVCHLWGAPLLFGSMNPEHFLTETNLSSTTRITDDKHKTLHHCVKNFTDSASKGKLRLKDAINVDLVLTTLAAINHIYCKKRNISSTDRSRIEKIITS